MTDNRGADFHQLSEPVDPPQMEAISAKEVMLLRLYRQLDEQDQDFIRRAVGAMVGKLSA